MENLTEKVLHYQRTRGGLAELMSDLAPRVYLFPQRKMGWDEDACGEFYVFFHPRLVRLLDRFRDQGKPFESYLCSVLAWQLRNFARERKRGERSWNVALRIETEHETASAEQAPGDADDEAMLEPGGRELTALIRTGSDRRNLLFFILKCSRNLDPGKTTALARLAGVPPERLASLMVELCEHRAPGRRGWRPFGADATAPSPRSAFWKPSFLAKRMRRRGPSSPSGCRKRAAGCAGPWTGWPAWGLRRRTRRLPVSSAFPRAPLTPASIG